MTLEQRCAFKTGDRVVWRRNSDISQERAAKRGEFIGLIKHTMRYNGVQLAGVQFDRNKRMSRVPLRMLEREKE